MNVVINPHVLGFESERAHHDFTLRTAWPHRAGQRGGCARGQRRNTEAIALDRVTIQAAVQTVDTSLESALDTGVSGNDLGTLGLVRVALLARIGVQGVRSGGDRRTADSPVRLIQVSPPVARRYILPVRASLVFVVVLSLLAGCGGNAGPAATRPPAGGTTGPVPSGPGAPPRASATIIGSAQTPTDTVAEPLPASGAPTSGPETTPFPIPTPLLPEMTPPPTPTGNDSLGAPSWVQPGTRITFYQAAASVAQSRFAWVEDPNGTWVVASTGKHYRRTDESGEGVGTASGDGVSQLDIVSLEGRDVVGSLVLYGIDHVNNQFVVGPATGWKVAGKVVDGVWVNPDLLAQLETQNLGGLLVLRGPYTLGNVSYDAISFANPTPGAYSSYTYDTKSGLLLSATTSTAGATSPISAANEPPPVGNTQLTITRLAGVRQRTPPGITGSNPAWVARTDRLEYSGTYNFTNPVDPSSANATFPMNVSVQLKPGGSNWSRYQAVSLIQMPGGTQSQSAGVTSSTGLYWIDPAALQGLTAGQVLDADPITGERDVVLSIDQGRNGPAVTVDYGLAGVHSQNTYDLATGVLLQLTVFTQSNGTTIRLALQQLP